MADGTVKIGVELDEAGLIAQIAALGGASEALMGGLGAAMSAAMAQGIGGSDAPRQAVQGTVDRAAGVDVSGFSGIGARMCEGVAAGIRRGQGGIVAAINQAAAAARAAFRAAMDIHSPSRVMMEDGQNIAEGVALGIEGGAGRVRAAMTELSSATGMMAPGGLGIEVSPPGLPGAGAGAAVSGGLLERDLSRMASRIAAAVGGMETNLFIDGRSMAQAQAEHNSYAISGRSRQIIQGFGG